VKPTLLLLAVPLPPQSLEAIGPFIEERIVDTEYGAVGPLARRGQSDGPPVWIQPYSGLPSRTDPRATMRAAQALNVKQIFAWDSVVALNPMLGPGHPMFITDYIDFTRHQPQTFFENEGTGGLSQTPAVCPRLTEALSHLLPTAPGGVYLGVDGPRRETATEARIFRSWGADVLGQNLVPEIALARELGICFAGLVSVDEISAERPPPPAQEENHRGLEAVVQALSAFLQSGEGDTPCDCGRR
jgi:5'-methylthioadenosine phosphorylase